MRLVVDIEANALNNPTKIWLIVCKDVDTGESYVFQEPSDRPEEAQRFLALAKRATHWIGHNWLEYDYPVLHNLLGLSIPRVDEVSTDTLIISRLVEYTRAGESVDLDTEDTVRYKGHSLESYGTEFGLPKLEFLDFTKYSPLMEEYCARDVAITHRVFLKYGSILNDPKWSRSIRLEHKFQLIANDLHTRGFAFNTVAANTLLDRVKKDLGELDEQITTAFPPKQVVVRTFTPKATKFGTISRTSVPRGLHGTIADYEVGKEYQLYKEQVFNPSSHKQLIEVLWEAGWQPTDRTKTHVLAEREYQRLKHTSNRDEEKFKELEVKLGKLKKTGFKINEDNLDTLPPSAPTGSRLLAKRILLESRRRTLVEWLSLVGGDSRIHGRFYGIGAWTHRMAHQKPNTANIPNEYDTQGRKKLLGKELRSLWRAPKNRLLVGIDADSIQFRIAAHYINDPELIRKIVEGKKSDKTDPHSYNKALIGNHCKDRGSSKRFLFSLILGGGTPMLASILECSNDLAEDARAKLYREYPGLVQLKQHIVIEDARRGYFIGLDGRQVRIPGDTFSQRKHLCSSGYLQNGEAIVIKLAACIAAPKLVEFDSFFVDIIHDEFQVECPNNVIVAQKVGQIVADAIKEAGEILGCKCPMQGSYYNDDDKRYTIGPNWSVTH